MNQWIEREGFTLKLKKEDKQDLSQNDIIESEKDVIQEIRQEVQGIRGKEEDIAGRESVDEGELSR